METRSVDDDRRHLKPTLTYTLTFMSPIRIILKAAKGPTGEYMSSWTLLPPRDETRAPSDIGGTPLSIARERERREENASANPFNAFGGMMSAAR